MKLAVLVLLAACRTGMEDYPYGTGGDPPKGHGSNGDAVDAGVDDSGDAGDGDAGAQITGRVCLVKDLRLAGVTAGCEPNGLAALKLVVSLGTRTASTADDGTFSIGAPQGAGFTWHVSGPANTIVRSAMPFGTSNLIPVVRDTRYIDLLQVNQAQLNELEGSVVMRVVRGTTVVVGVTALSLDATNDRFGSLYDSADIDDWATVSTGTFGMVWIPSIPIPVPARPVTVQLSDQTGLLASPTVTLEDQTITFVTQDLQ
jgi:hypothetical protein